MSIQDISVIHFISNFTTGETIKDDDEVRRDGSENNCSADKDVREHNFTKHMTEELVIECIENSLKDKEELNESVFVKCNNCEFVSATLDDLKTHEDSNHETRKFDNI